MVRRRLLVKLNRENREGLNYVRLKRAAETALMGSYGVQSVHIERAADPDTARDWDLCITIEYVSHVDEARSSTDPVRLAFERKFLGARAENVWSGAFSSD